MRTWKLALVALAGWMAVVSPVGAKQSAPVEKVKLPRFDLTVPPEWTLDRVDSAREEATLSRTRKQGLRDLMQVKVDGLREYADLGLSDENAARKALETQKAELETSGGKLEAKGFDRRKIAAMDWHILKYVADYGGQEFKGNLAVRLFDRLGPSRLYLVVNATAANPEWLEDAMQEISYALSPHEPAWGEGKARLDPWASYPIAREIVYDGPVCQPTAENALVPAKGEFGVFIHGYDCDGDLRADRLHRWKTGNVARAVMSPEVWRPLDRDGDGKFDYGIYPVGRLSVKEKSGTTPTNVYFHFADSDGNGRLDWALYETGDGDGDTLVDQRIVIQDVNGDGDADKGATYGWGTSVEGSGTPVEIRDGRLVLKTAMVMNPGEETLLDAKGFFLGPSDTLAVGSALNQKAPPQTAPAQTTPAQTAPASPQTDPVPPPPTPSVPPAPETPVPPQGQ